MGNSIRGAASNGGTSHNNNTNTDTTNNTNTDTTKKTSALYTELRSFKDYNKELRYAASRGYYERVMWAIEVGADLNSGDSEGNTALILAATHGHYTIIRALLEAGAKASITNNKGDNALDYAAAYECRVERYAKCAYILRCALRTESKNMSG